MTGRPPRDRRGFMVLSALMLLFVAAGMVVVFAQLVVTQAHRTRSAGSEAQMRQLLTAGAAAAAELVTGREAADDGQTWSIPLPPELKEGETLVEVSISQPTEGERVASVEVAVADRSSRQHLRFIQEDGAWTLVEARLGGAAFEKH